MRQQDGCEGTQEAEGGMSKTDAERIDALEKQVAELVAWRGKVLAAFGGGGGSSAGSTASDADLDGKFGNPTIKKDPPKWTGATCLGKRYSECPPGYLDSLAGFLDWKAEKNMADNKTKFAGYDRADAARARGWAARLRAGWVAPKEAPSSFGGQASGFGASDGFGGGGFSDGPSEFDSDEEIPF